MEIFIVGDSRSRKHKVAQNIQKEKGKKTQLVLGSLGVFTTENISSGLGSSPSG